MNTRFLSVSQGMERLKRLNESITHIKSLSDSEIFVIVDYKPMYHFYNRAFTDLIIRSGNHILSVLSHKYYKDNPLDYKKFKHIRVVRAYMQILGNIRTPRGTTPLIFKV